VKIQGLDGGFKNRKAQGSKREEKDLSANTFELEMDGGLIPQKGRGSLTKSPWLKGGTRLLIWAVGSKSNGSDAFRFGRSDLDRTGPI
jgi:hypothetical protein